MKRIVVWILMLCGWFQKGKPDANPERGILVITHYQRLLEYIVPDFVHVMTDGKIVRTGGKELALELEDRGYDWIKQEIAVIPPTLFNDDKSIPS